MFTNMSGYATYRDIGVTEGVPVDEPVPERVGVLVGVLVEVSVVVDEGADDCGFSDAGAARDD
jgi:hypothetical protein